jgi:hypothetical protein
MLPKDFRNSLYIVWKKLGLPEPTPVQYDIAHFLQYGPRRGLIQAFRGVGKSWIASTFAVDCLARDPSLNIMYVSASKQRADDASAFMQRLIQEVPMYHFLKASEGQRDSRVAFDVGPAPPSHAPSVVSKGITSQITGSRAGLIIPDDIESLNNSATQVMRDKLQEQIKEFDAVLKPGGRIIFLGTPQSEQTIYNVLPDRGYTVKIWPARVPENNKIYGNKLAKIINGEPGEPTDPKRFNDEDLKEREASYGRSGFAMQFMLNPTLSDKLRYPLRLSDLRVMPLAKDLAPVKPMKAAEIKDLPCVGLSGDRYYEGIAETFSPYTGSVMAIDPSGRGSDETAYAVVKMLDGYLFVVAAGGVEGGYSSETLTQLATIAKDHRVNYCVIESNFGDGMFSELFKPYLRKIHPMTLEEVRHNIQKERRIIDTLEPVMNQGRLIVNRSVIEHDFLSTKHLPPEEALKYQLFYQMTRISKDKGCLAHDDRLDALSMAVGYWSNQMAQDADAQIARRKQQALDKELQDFMEYTVGRKPTQSWNVYQRRQ